MLRRFIHISLGKIFKAPTRIDFQINTRACCELLRSNIEILKNGLTIEDLSGELLSKSDYKLVNSERVWGLKCV